MSLKTDQFQKYTGKKDAILGKVKITEDADKCCKCIPLELGVKVLGVLCILGALGTISNGFSYLSVSMTLLALGTFVLVLPQCLASYLFFKFFMDKKKKDDLPDAMFYLFLSQITLIIFQGVVTFMTFKLPGALITAAVSALFSFIFSSYYYGVVKRYAE